MDGYYSAIVGKNNKAVKNGLTISEESELPDAVKNCSLMIWNNHAAIDRALELDGCEVIK